VENGATKYVYDYSKLLGRIKEKGHTIESLSRIVGITSWALSRKLHNMNDFKQREILLICFELDIRLSDLEDYFFYKAA